MTPKLKMSEVKRAAARIKVNKGLKDSGMTYQIAPQFIKDKIYKGRKMIAIAGLPE